LWTVQEVCLSAEDGTARNDELESTQSYNICERRRYMNTHVAEAWSVVSNKRQLLCVSSYWEPCRSDETHAKIDNG
jgi:hypothetical protein